MADAGGQGIQVVAASDDVRQGDLVPIVECVNAIAAHGALLVYRTGARTAFWSLSRMSLKRQLADRRRRHTNLPRSPPDSERRAHIAIGQELLTRGFLA